VFNVLAMVAEFEADPEFEADLIPSSKPILLIRAHARGVEGSPTPRAACGQQPKLTPRQEAHLAALHRTGSTPPSSANSSRCAVHCLPGAEPARQNAPTTDATA
jgi:hypothetical protein